MNQRLVRTGSIALLLTLALVLFVGGCISGDDETTTTTLPVTSLTVITAPPAEVTGDTSSVALDQLSTFQSKDPFRQQALPPTTRTTSTPTGGSTTSTTASGSTTSTTGGGTTTTQPSGVNNALHGLKILSVDLVNGIPVVTFEVDDTVYEDKREGDVVSTTWGQIKVVSIDAEEQVVVFLHGSETRTLMVGQEFLK
ncbi:MAG: hypothetical protein ACYC33_12675 [Thermoleophilia bacterium]